MEAKKIHLTAALPTWENKNIIWLQLESLCRQETDFNWELIVCEEQTQRMLGKVDLMEYEPRLAKVGCKQIKYKPLQNKIPLSQKWVKIASEAQGDSFALCAADDYSAPNRLQISHHTLKQGYNWFDVKKTLNLNLFDFTTATYINQPKDNNTGSAMCTKTSIVKGLNGPPWPTSGVDGWMRTNGNAEPYFQHHENLLGLVTDGANKINFDRINRYPDKKIRKRYVCPYFPPEQKVEDILPEEIITRLKNLRIEKHPNHL